MSVVFSPIFMADTKIIFRNDFVAPLSVHNIFVQTNDTVTQSVHM